MPRPILPLVLLLAIALAACSGTPATSASADGNAATATSTASSDGGDGSSGGDSQWCLNTTDEVASTLDVEVTDAVGTDAPGVGGGCFYNGPDGTPVHAISVITAASAADTFNAAKSQAGAETIDGIGDDAVLVSSGGPLIVLKGDSVISMGPVGAIQQDATAFRAAVEELGRTAADRLP